MKEIGDPGQARVHLLREWSQNGLDELTLGVLLCVLGGIFLPGYSLPKATFFGRNYGMIAPFLEAAFFLAMVLTLKKVRARLIFPRTGYVEFRPQAPRIWILLAFQGVAAVIAVAAVFWRSGLPDLSRAWGPACGFLFAACFWWGGITYRLPHFLWIAGMALLLGGVTFAAGAKINGAMWVFVGVGVVLSLDGAARMKRFVENHPIVEAQHG
jgi:hypothetical protein